MERRGLVGGLAWERAVSDINSQVRDILAFHLGIDGCGWRRRRFEDLGADSLDVIEIVMSCEEQFGIEIPNREATGLATVGDAVRCVADQIEAPAAERPPSSRPKSSRPRRTAAKLSVKIACGRPLTAK